MDELIANDHGDFIYQQDGAPPHCAGLSNNSLPRRWIGRASGEDDVMLKWPPRSPDLTPCDFFSGNT